MRKIKPIELSPSERVRLENFTNSGQALAREIKHGQILLKLAQGWSYQQIAQAFEVSQRTVLRVKQRFEKEGLEAALHDKPRSGAPPKLDGDLKALVVATTCSTAPNGHRRWTLRMLAARLIELEAVEKISPESIRQILKKTNSSPGNANSGSFREWEPSS